MICSLLCRRQAAGPGGERVARRRGKKVSKTNGGRSGDRSKEADRGREREFMEIPRLVKGGSPGGFTGEFDRRGKLSGPKVPEACGAGTCRPIKQQSTACEGGATRSRRGQNWKSVAFKPPEGKKAPKKKREESEHKKNCSQNPSLKNHDPRHIKVVDGRSWWKRGVSGREKTPNKYTKTNNKWGGKN